MEPSYWAEIINGEQATENHNIHAVRVRHYHNNNIAEVSQKQGSKMIHDRVQIAPTKVPKVIKIEKFS